MQLKIDAYFKSLDKQLKPLYIIAGNEPLQKLEAIDALKKKAQSCDFEINADLEVDSNFHWRLVENVFNSASLFHKKQFLHIDFGDKKIDKKSLANFFELLPTLEKNGDIVLFSVNKFDKASTKTKWFLQLDKAGIFVQIWQIDESNLPNWILTRSKKYSYNLSLDGAKFLADMSFGNLLAVAGELEKLEFLAGDTNIVVDAAYLENMTYNSSSYSIFDLTRYLVECNLIKFWQVLEYLRLSGEEEILILWSFTREVRLLYAMKLALERGENFDQVCRVNRVWRNQNSYAKLLQKLSLRKLEFVITKIYQLDTDIKSSKKNNLWKNLLDLARFLTK